MCICRSYHEKSIASHQHSEIKPHWAPIVLRLVITWEVGVMTGIFPFLLLFAGSIIRKRKTFRDQNTTAVLSRPSYEIIFLHVQWTHELLMMRVCLSWFQCYSVYLPIIHGKVYVSHMWFDSLFPQRPETSTTPTYFFFVFFFGASLLSAQLSSAFLQYTSYTRARKKRRALRFVFSPPDRARQRAKERTHARARALFLSLSVYLWTHIIPPLERIKKSRLS